MSFVCSGKRFFFKSIIVTACQRQSVWGIITTDALFFVMEDKMKILHKRFIPAVLCIALAFGLCGCTGSNTENSTGASTTAAQTEATAEQAPQSEVVGDDSKYSSADNWAYLAQGNDKQADVFVLCPTIFPGSSQSFNMPLDDEEMRQKFYNTLTTGLGIYSESCTVYAPYYQQVGMVVYGLDENLRETYFKTAYNDVRESFLYYMQHYNNGRPIVLAGFSQGADMVLRLMKEFFTDEEYSKQLVAAYAVGWHFSQAEANQYPALKMAQEETDTGVIITFNSEEDYVTTSLLVPDTTLSINPLNWKTDGTVADKSENLGAVFCDENGNITEEIPQFTGAYIDQTRGTLKLTDVDDTVYTNGFSTFGTGVYHVYDCEFFYRNLQKNVNDRISAFINNS